MVKLGDVLTFVGVPEKITEPAIEKYVTVQNNGRGAIRRVIKDGKSPVPFTGYRIKPGQFIYSRIDARNGAFAIIPEELDNFVVSKDFPIFEVQNHLVTPQYLLEFLKSGNIQKIIQNLSRGATNRQRIKEAEFLDFPFPLPSLEEQKRIVSILDKAKSIQEARERQLAALDELITTIFKNLLSGKYPSSPLGKLATFYGGSSLPEGSVVPSKSFSMLMKVSDMNRSGNEKYIAATGLYSTQTTTGNSTCPKGSIVLPKRGASILTNKKRITTQNTMLDPNLMGITPNSSVNLEYLYNWFQCFDLATIVSGSSVPQINKRDLSPLKVPVPPLYLQEELAHKIKIIEAQAILTRKSLELDKTLFSSLQSSLLRSKC